MIGVTEEAYQRSVDLLRDLTTESGFIAAPVQDANYARVFSRDGVIAGMAALKTDDDYLRGIFRNTLETLRDTQHETGRIASNVSVDKKSISYGHTVGRIDASLWYLIGVCQYFLHTGDKSFFKSFRLSLEKVIAYLSSLELNGRGLIYIPPGGDWADEYIVSGYALYDQVLYYIGLHSYQRAAASNGDMKNKTTRLRQLLLVNYFPYAKNKQSPYVYHKNFFDMHAKRQRPNIPLSSFYQSIDIDGQVDNFGNGLLLSSDILSGHERDALIQDVANRFLSVESAILPAFFPVITKRSTYWKFLFSNNWFGFRNWPHEYHNGGQWPLVHGFFLASMRGDHAHELLEQFAHRLKKHDYRFPEFYHGRTGAPGGVNRIGFSAAGYILAYSGISGRHKVFH